MQEKQILIDDLSINYKIEGEGKPILILHGWGGSSDSWIKIIEGLKKDFLLICPDLPGFGKSSFPKFPWELDNYVFLVKKFIEALNLKKIILIGHSFGGKIAIKFVSLFPEYVELLILCAPSGMRKKSGFKQKVLLFFSFFGNLLFKIKFFSSFKGRAQDFFYSLINSDYRKTKGTMRETFKKIVSVEVLDELPKILPKTYIIWGEKDKILPIEQANFFAKNIKNAILLTLPNFSHSPHLEKPKEFVEILKKILVQKP
jgi:pimeloyl-ACP methyl ester carboxylesterase